ncbi:hypothetical protein JCM31826_18460 [Thermaurantimonas aggregans]|uniref:Rod shape-determining protein MreD n=1 Tax=Thermaurantimonas aggregans TaxID=2173829 RepID=A0A401XMW9_9FLAO|nr:hypothetical protein [Thermaurantimonas aggregans]MCX8148137.1 hypothetical protein [Thermaurantimonas aggregans]GCD78364.1 hypothetical protein JCM31826_18460 [Thermaurantimonas aggregans]
MKTSDVAQWIVAIVFAIVLQIGVLDQVKLSGYINPQLLPAFVVMSKPVFNKYAHLLIAFLAGFAIDVWNSTGGLYASSLSLLSFVPVQRVLGYAALQEAKSIRIETVKFNRFLLYLLLSYLLFFIWIYVVDSLGFGNLMTLLRKTIASTTASLALIVPVEYVLTKGTGSKNGR